jgi:hypothetical protein
MVQIIIQQVARFNPLNQMIFNNIAENTYKIKHTTTRQLSCFISMTYQVKFATKPIVIRFEGHIFFSKMHGISTTSR